MSQPLNYDMKLRSLRASGQLKEIEIKKKDVHIKNVYYPLLPEVSIIYLDAQFPCPSVTFTFPVFNLKQSSLFIIWILAESLNLKILVDMIICFVEAVQ